MPKSMADSADQDLRPSTRPLDGCPTRKSAPKANFSLNHTPDLGDNRVVILSPPAQNAPQAPPRPPCLTWKTSREQSLTRPQ
jgi:hypothetical protein